MSLLNNIIKKIIKFRCIFIFDKIERKRTRSKLYNYYLNYIDKIKVKEFESSQKQSILQIHKKLGLKDDIFNFNGIKFYVPLYPVDYIQKYIVETKNFYELRYLKYLDKYIEDESNILDIGSNIGNHSIYWSKVRNANNIYCFEPVKETFEILQKNIEINNLSDTVHLHNVGVGDKNIKGTIAWSRQTSIGATSIKESENGEFDIIRIDDIKFNNKIDFVKIDVEGFELNVLNGMSELLKRDMPVITVESYGEKIPKVISFLENIGYENKGNLVYPLDFLFIPKN